MTDEHVLDRAPAPLAAADGRRLRSLVPNVLAHGIELYSLLGLIIAWEILGRVLALPWLPPISAIAGALVEIYRRGELSLELVSSLNALAVGFGISLAIGIPVGALMGRYRRIDQALHAYVYTFFVAPNVIFVPVFFALFGLAAPARIAVIIMYAVFFLIINVRAGVRNVDPSLIEMGRSFGASDLRSLALIIIPAAMPLVMAGVRLATVRSVKGMVNSEMFIAVIGLGALSRKYGSQFDMDSTFAIVFVILVFALTLNAIAARVESRLTRWMD